MQGAFGACMVSPFASWLAQHRALCHFQFSRTAHGSRRMIKAHALFLKQSNGPLDSGSCVDTEVGLSVRAQKEDEKRKEAPKRKESERARPFLEGTADAAAARCLAPEGVRRVPQM